MPWRAIAFALLGLAALGIGLGVVIALRSSGPPDPLSVKRPLAIPAANAKLPPDPVSEVIYETAVMPIAPQDARALNAARPADVESVPSARAFAISGRDAADPHYEAALHCLAQAIYYEAGSESEKGQRAVAQVVLNRVRHPLFPDTVCGVVYQGAERWTGCQFTFTCDGSLQRTPSAGGFARAERVARQALAGRVEASVGNATHYHADFVVPYWAASLDKVTTIGAHIFYLMRGPLGAPRAFNAPYALALEVPPGGSLASLAAQEMAGSQSTLTEETGIGGMGVSVLSADARSGRLTKTSVAPLPDASTAASSRLRADQTAGKLDPGRAGSRLIVDDKSNAKPRVDSEKRFGRQADIASD